MIFIYQTMLSHITHRLVLTYFLSPPEFYPKLIQFGSWSLDLRYANLYYKLDIFDSIIAYDFLL